MHVSKLTAIAVFADIVMTPVLIGGKKSHSISSLDLLPKFRPPISARGAGSGPLSESRHQANLGILGRHCYDCSENQHQDKERKQEKG